MVGSNFTSQPCHPTCSYRRRSPRTVAAPGLAVDAADDPLHLSLQLLRLGFIGVFVEQVEHEENHEVRTRDRSLRAALRVTRLTTADERLKGEVDTLCAPYDELTISTKRSINSSDSSWTVLLTRFLQECLNSGRSHVVLGGLTPGRERIEARELWTALGHKSPRTHSI